MMGRRGVHFPFWSEFSFLPWFPCFSFYPFCLSLRLVWEPDVSHHFSDKAILESDEVPHKALTSKLKGCSRALCARLHTSGGSRVGLHIIKLSTCPLSAVSRVLARFSVLLSSSSNILSVFIYFGPLCFTLSVLLLGLISKWAPSVIQGRSLPPRPPWPWSATISSHSPCPRLTSATFLISPPAERAILLLFLFFFFCSSFSREVK